MGQVTSCVDSRSSTKQWMISSDCSHGGSDKRVDFPFDIIHEILSRLPADNLIRLRTVCKLWNKLITDHDFIELHLSKWIHKPPSHLILAPYRASCDSTRSLILVDRIEESGWKAREIQVECFPYKRFQLYGSCNGLICMAPALGWHSIFINNPITGESLRLPEANLADKFRIIPFYCSIGFGFDHGTKKYKVFRLLDYKKNDQHQFFGEVITLGEISWRKLDIPVTNSRNIRASPMLFLNGFLYCIGHGFILVIDIGSEKFATVNVPSLGVLECRSGLANMEGSLAFVILHYASNSNGVKISKIWRIVGSMTMGFSFEQCSYPTHGDILYALLSDGTLLLQCSELNEVSEDTLMCEPALFMPSFVSLSDIFDFIPSNEKEQYFYWNIKHSRIV